MRCPNFLTKSWFVVEREASECHEPFDLDIHVSDLVYRGGDTKTMTVPHAGSFIFIAFVTPFFRNHLDSARHERKDDTTLFIVADSRSDSHGTSNVQKTI